MRLLLLLLTAGLLPSCSFAPSIDEQGEVSIAQPNRLMRYYSELQFEHFKKTRAISLAPRHTEPVDRVAKKLKQAIDMPDAEWEFVVFKDKSPNAFALSGGKVGINTGLFQIADNDALLAAVLGHEISHATSNHSEQRMYHAMGTLFAAAIIWAALENNDVEHPAYGLAAYGLASYFSQSLPLARKQEYESDRIGAIFMAKAGYDPRQAVTLWQRIEAYHNKQLNEGKRKKPKAEFLRTHPHDSKRIQALKDFMPIALRHYRKP